MSYDRTASAIDAAAPAIVSTFAYFERSVVPYDLGIVGFERPSGSII